MKTYLAIDLKSFYASVECVERKLDPLTTRLVVADSSRTNKTICLAVTPALKKYGLSGRSRLFEVEQKAREVKRRTGKELDYIIAPPRMALYIKYSKRIYNIYLKYFSEEDIHVYSVDEVFIDLTSYLSLYNIGAEELTRKVILDVFKTTGITATAGIAPNLFLSKVAMDIIAKHVEADENGARIAYLDELSFRQKLWNHKPLTDFWRIGKGTERRLEKNFIFTLGDLARRSLENEESLYKLFGIDAEILIDHAWGYEPVSIRDIKRYKSKQHGISLGQVLQRPYNYSEGKIIVREMAESLITQLLEKKITTDRVCLFLFYDVETLNSPFFDGDIAIDYYGRVVPHPSQGGIAFESHTSLSSKIVNAVLILYDKIVNKNYLIRKINISFNNVAGTYAENFTLFDDIDKIKKEKSLQNTMMHIHNRYGKNSLLKGTNLQEASTMLSRNNQIGGHRK